MRPAEIERLHREHKVVGSGPIAPSEAVCILRAIERHRPRSFVELGTSSGLSTGLIANMLHDNRGKLLVSYDVSPTYYRDDARTTGFLVPRLYSGRRVEVRLRSPFTSIEVAQLPQTYDMGFVDGAHQHPWPLIDTLCLRTRLTGSKVLFHHDLNLYKNQPLPKGIGPKYLFDQFPESHRRRYAANRGNLFSLSLDLPLERLEEIAMEAFALPWTTLRRMEGPRLDGFREILRENYSTGLLEAFESCRERFAVARRA